MTEERIGKQGNRGRWRGKECLREVGGTEERMGKQGNRGRWRGKEFLKKESNTREKEWWEGLGKGWVSEGMGVGGKGKNS